MSDDPFAPLVGLRTAKRVAESLVTGKTFAQAVLFYGTEGAGKSALAAMVAQAWLCTDPQPSGACGVCGVCTAFASGRMVDFQVVRPRGRSSLIKVSAINEGGKRDEDDDEESTVPIRTFFRTRPLMARHKVVLMESCERMNPSAANALLKTLEEPLPHAKLLLTSAAISRVPATIVSRCLAVACQLPSAEELDALVPDAEDWERVLSEGAPGRLIRIREHRAAFRSLMDAFEAMPALAPGGGLAAAEMLESAIEKVGKALGLNARAANAEGVRLLAVWLGAVYPRLTAARAEAIETHRRILGNANAGLHLDMLCIRILRDIGRNAPIGELPRGSAA